ncbi:putative threonine dehydratase isoform X1 [Mugil cephalus]|uniref:putative threonine dehydratase isoform X1 n=1 Tax=Mugil cephalus TaxID=48193 RepID=UPI001FB855AE|nr:putative threonine dehydratase isoform X1 [Mugil cephalus]XP_047430641.1 putative threonine dehydratase isoform X1 [Mugil cephalus]
MGEVSADAVTLDLLREARETVRSSPLGVINTPMVAWCQTTLPFSISCNIQIKLENMQRTGSFKIRGVANQFARRPKGGRFVTMSAGNYGKSFAYASKHYGSKGKVVMPETAPESRSTLIQSFGVEVERAPTSSLIDVVNRCVREDNMTFLHSYDDLDLIAGHASLGMELLEVMPEPDVVVVCCGGGGLLAGVAAAIKLSGCGKTRIYGVEPEGASRRRSQWGWTRGALPRVSRRLSQAGCPTSCAGATSRGSSWLATRRSRQPCPPSTGPGSWSSRRAPPPLLPSLTTGYRSWRGRTSCASSAEGTLGKTSLPTSQTDTKITSYKSVQM